MKRLGKILNNTKFSSCTSGLKHNFELLFGKLFVGNFWENFKWPIVTKILKVK